MSVIPDPIEPYKRAIDGKTGELLVSLLWCPKAPTDRPPTLAELIDGAVQIGWTGKDAFGGKQ